VSEIRWLGVGVPSGDIRMDTDARVEAISSELHDQYLATAKRLGWPIKPANDVPYSQLSEDAKELDRVYARWHLAALDAFAKARERAAWEEAARIVGNMIEVSSATVDTGRIWRNGALLAAGRALKERARLHAGAKGDEG